MATCHLIEAIQQTADADVIEVIARADLAATEEAMNTSLGKAVQVVQELENFKWALVEAIEHLGDHRQEAARAILNSLKESFQKDEYAISLGPALREIESKAARLLADVPRSQPNSASSTETAKNTGAILPTTQIQDAATPASRRTGLSAGDLEALFTEIRQKLEENPKARLNLTWEVYES